MNYKLNLILEMKIMIDRYYELVSKLQNIFLTIKEKKEIEAEIKIIEKTLKSKIFMSESMRGY